MIAYCNILILFYDFNKCYFLRIDAINAPYMHVYIR